MKTPMTTLILSIALATIASAGIPVGPEETSTVDLGGPEVGIPDTWASLYVLPDGAGPGFDASFVLNGGGQEVDATIRVTVIHPIHGIIVGFPAEDLWLLGASGGLVPCGNTVIADGPSDSEGVATFTRAPSAGGWDDQGLTLFFSGSAWWGPNLPVRVNSPDIDGNGRVDLADAGFFAVDLLIGPFHYRSDFNGDGRLNLSDAGFFADGVGASCP